ncbi:ABC transporter permease [Candidatus Saccharibacteria bacterium]|nr:ABC transporter permease [Candidatus Saccharibacteria bacterium]
MNHWLITQWRIVKTGAQNFVRNLTLAIAAIAVMVITLTIILFSVIASQTFNNTIQQITNKIDISIYLKDSVAANDEQRTKIMDELKAFNNVREVKFISKEDALEAYKEANKKNPDLLAAISQTDNPLPASLQVKPVDPNKIDEIKAYLEKPEIKALQSEETSYSGDRKVAIDKITQATTFMQRAGVVGIIIFTIVSIMIIFNTIRMAIFNRRDELHIMRLLGASTWFIRGPFVVETVMYGIIAALLSVLICNSLFVVSSSAFEASSLGVLDIKFAANFFSDHYLVILTAQLAIGILIGAASSAIATRRYLKFKTSK